MVGGEGHAVMGLSLGHLLVPVQAQVGTQGHLLLWGGGGEEYANPTFGTFA